MALHLGGAYLRKRGLILRRKTPQFAICKAYFCIFFPCIKHVFRHVFTSCKIWNLFKVNNIDTRIRKINGKVKNKDSVDVVLASLWLTWNTVHFLLQCFYLWLRSVNCQLGLMFVVLTLCVSAEISLGKLMNKLH